MSTYRFDKLFSSRSVAILGASPRPASLGRTILQNLIAARYGGAIHLVSPHHPEVDGIRAVQSLAALAEAPEVVVIATPPETVPGLVAEAGAKGAAVAVIITAGLGHGPGSFADACARAARPYGMRIVGPNCLGVIVPHAGFNASFAARMPRAGDLALVSQSGAIVAGVIEWAARRAAGFSAVVSLGDQVDVDFGDLLDFFALDRRTRAILLYVEAITDARKFMSAARAAARMKPVVVIKAGRHPQAAKAAATHTGALAGSDAVYEAAFRRAGLLRVLGLDELFDAAEALGSLKPFPGKRLAILTNGGGVGVLAVDRLIDLGGTLAALSPDTLKTLDAALPPYWSRANPVDIGGDADDSRYGAALEALLDDPANDAIVVMNVPTALASAAAAAERVAEIVRAKRAHYFPHKPVFAVWVGGDEDVSAAFKPAKIPHYGTEADAMRGFMHLVRYREAQEELMKTPPSLPEDFSPDTAAARRIIAGALAQGRGWLDPTEASELLAAYRIPIVPAVTARSPEEAAAAAAPFLKRGDKVAVKILSPDIVHKSDVGGVRLNLANAEAIRAAAVEVMARARAAVPAARITGVSVHPMIVRPKARELIAGVADDLTFGPVIVFGHGGTAVEVIDDKALALPPLDLKIAHDLIARTRVSRLLKGYRNEPAANEAEIALTLVKLGQLATDLAEVREIDINPLLADADGVIALDARVAVAKVVEKAKGSGHPRCAIRPYPKEWERRLPLDDGTWVIVRPVRPEDEELFRRFFDKVTAEDLRLRFFAAVRDFSHGFIARLTQIDYARAMAFAAIEEVTGELLGVVRLHADSTFQNGEYAILLRSDLKGRGLGWKLMQLIIEYARSEGLKQIVGQVLAENRTMLDMCDALGFHIELDPLQNNVRVVRLDLDEKTAAGALSR
jgi:acetyltransferase